MHEKIPFKLGHVLVQVDNLQESITDYTAMGFIVVPGGPPDRMGNAMIYLQDGSFIELFSTNKGKISNAVLYMLVKLMKIIKPSYANRLEGYLPGGKGLKDFALDSSPSNQYKYNMTRVRENGLNISKPQFKKRITENSETVTWSLAYPDNVNLPFLMSAYDPPNVLDELTTNHPNGAFGIELIQLKTTHTQWDSLYDGYSRLLGVIPPISGKEPSRSAKFEMKGTIIELLEGTTKGIDHIVLSGEKKDMRNQMNPMPPFIIKGY